MFCSEQTVPKQRKGSLFHPSCWLRARHIQTLCFLSAYTAWVQSYTELCPPYAPPANITALEVKVLAATSTGSLEVSPPIWLTFFFPTVVIEVVSANEENSSLYKWHPFPVLGQNVTLSFCNRSDSSPCSSLSTVVCVCSHLSNSRKQVKLKCPEWDLFSIYWWLITLQQWGFQKREVFLLQAEITCFSTASG